MATKKGGRKPRKPRAPRVPRETSQRLKRASESAILMKRRIIALESRMVVLERLLDYINNPTVQQTADLLRTINDTTLLDYEQFHGSEEE